MSRTAEDVSQSYRDALADEIQAEARDTTSWTGRTAFDERVMAAIRTVPRHAFIPEAVPLAVAYANRPQPIGHGQTISQPYIVALMTDLLDLGDDARVLEVGAGCGYQSAVLAEIAAEVYAVERLEPLAEGARATLKRLGYDNVHLTCADGTEGWAEHAPYDGILVTACFDGPVPRALTDQLRPGGRIVIPLGPRWGPQMLHLGFKDAEGRFHHQPVLAVAFVPLVTGRE
ncbi:MAG: protein-L-isoaspartate(D-aspartate) O-methyltransferase [Arenibacter algicola]|nr:protein-L-isoaspartate(D-aspartate) O-methyltransferase [Arenibacter algicola]